MAQKKKTLSAYQKKTQRISRARSLRYRMRQLIRRTVIFGSVLAVAGIGGTGWWWVHSGKLAQVWEDTRQAALLKTADAGFALEYIYLEGRQHANKDQLTAALGLQAGDPILGVSVEDIQTRIRKLPWVRNAVVERQLPDTLHVHVEERQPVAVWQHDNALYLVDETGFVIDKTDPGELEYRHLLLVVGEDAPQYVNALMAMLGKEEDLFRRVSAAIRVGKRRWNILFHNKIEVKLPANNPERAWAMLAEMERQQQLLARNIHSVDLRLEDRIFIDLPPDAKNLLSGISARET